MGIVAQFTENDFRILKAILDRGDRTKGLTIVSGTTVVEISIKTGLSKNKVRDSLNKFIVEGYVTEGVKKVRTKTYLLTKDGFTILNNIRKSIHERGFLNE